MIISSDDLYRNYWRITADCAIHSTGSIISWIGWSGWCPSIQVSVKSSRWHQNRWILSKQCTQSTANHWTLSSAKYLGLTIDTKLNYYDISVTSAKSALRHPSITTPKAVLRKWRKRHILPLCALSLSMLELSGTSCRLTSLCRLPSRRTSLNWQAFRRLRRQYRDIRPVFICTF